MPCFVNRCFCSLPVLLLPWPHPRFRGLFLDPMTLLEGSNDNTTDTESTIENSSSHHKHHQRQMNVSGLNFMMEKMDYFIR